MGSQPPPVPLLAGAPPARLRDYKFPGMERWQDRGEDASFVAAHFRATLERSIVSIGIPFTSSSFTSGWQPYPKRESPLNLK